MDTFLLGNIAISGVRHNQVHLIWKEVEPFIAKALKHADDKYNLRYVKLSLFKRDMQLWVLEKGKEIVGCVVTQICIYPNSKRLLIFALAGEGFDNWQHHFATIKAWAKEEGCESCEIYGRPGWERKLNTMGFEKISTVLKVKL
jgi:hypothetical protein